MIRYRPAELADIPELAEIRGAVRENRLVRLKIETDDYVRAFTVEGRAWVAEDQGRPIGFVCGRPAKGDIWALFLRAEYEGQGIGNALLEIVERWMAEQGLASIRLSTAPGTRAERLYRRRGWKAGGLNANGELELTLDLRR